MSVPPETEGGGGERVLGVELPAALFGKAAGDGGGLALLVGETAGGEGFDGGDGGEDLEDPLGDGDICGWFRRVVLQLDGGGGTGGEQLDEEGLGELRHRRCDAGAELGEAGFDGELGILPKNLGEGLDGFGGLGSQGGDL